MSRILFCTSDPLIFKHLYGILRDDGFTVDMAGHTAAAVRMAIEAEYAAVVLDAKCVGLPAVDAARIISEVRPRTHIVIAGAEKASIHAVHVTRPPDARIIRRAVHAACGT